MHETPAPRLASSGTVQKVRMEFCLPTEPQTNLRLRKLQRRAMRSFRRAAPNDRSLGEVEQGRNSELHRRMIRELAGDGNLRAVDLYGGEHTKYRDLREGQYRKNPHRLPISSC